MLTRAVMALVDFVGLTALLAAMILAGALVGVVAMYYGSMFLGHILEKIL